MPARTPSSATVPLSHAAGPYLPFTFFHSLRKKRHLGTRFVSFYADEDYTDEDSSDEGLTDEGHPSENHTHDDYSSGDHADENADEKMRVCSRGLRDPAKVL